MKLNNEKFLSHYSSNNVSNLFLEIVKPLKDIVLGKDIFYFRTYKDGGVIMLSTNLAYVSNWLCNFDCFDNTLFQEKLNKTISSVSNVYCAWNYNKQDNLLEFNHNYELDQGFDIYKRQKDYVEMWAFVGKTDISQFHDFCLNNIIKLESMITLYNKILIEKDDMFFLEKALLPINISFDLSSFREKHLTFRELECARLIIVGKTAKEIARELDISTKTVDVYINNIKQKTGCLYKHELIKFYKNCL